MNIIRRDIVRGAGRDGRGTRRGPLHDGEDGAPEGRRRRPSKRHRPSQEEGDCRHGQDGQRADNIHIEQVEIQSLMKYYHEFQPNSPQST